MERKKYTIYCSLILLAIVILVSFIMGTKAEALRQASPAEKENEKIFVKTTATISRGEDLNKKVNKETLEGLLNKYVGEGKTTVTQKSTTRLLVRFLETGDEYEIDIDTAAIAYTVTYDANGGEDPPAPQTKYDGMNLKLTESIPWKSERLFVGWNTEADGTGTIYQPGDIYTEDSSITLYAVWKEDLMPVTYWVDTDEKYTEDVYVGRSVLSPTTFTPQKEGWTFMGWREDVTPSGDILTEKVQERSLITLYAIFKEDVTATFNRKDITDPVTKQRYYNNGTITNPTFTFPNGADSDFSGWTWRGWSDSGVTTSNAEVKYSNGETVTLATNATFYGLYRKELIQTFVSNGTSTSKTGISYYNASGSYKDPTVTFPTGATYSGWTWRGWSNAGDTTADGEVKYANGQTITVTESNTYYGLYSEELTQTFKSQGTSIETITRTGVRYYNAYGNYKNPTVTFPTGATYSGWTWRGWSEAEDITANAEIKYNNGQTITVTESNTYYGLYSKTLTQKFVSNGSTKNEPVTRYYNASGSYKNPTVTFPTGTTYSGWTWRGWSASGVTTANAEIKYNNGQTITVTGDNTFYGLYNKTITLSYNGNGNTGGSTTSHSGKRYYSASNNYSNPSFTLKSNGFTKSGYQFIKWELGNAGAAVTLTENITTKAIWEKIPAIGDLVNYTPASFNNYQVSKSVSGYRNGPETYIGNDIKNKGLKWRILDINSSTGVIKIVSQPFGLKGVGTKGHHFEGQTGQSNAQTVLNNICKTVLATNTNVATSTESLRESDINNLVGFTPSGKYGGYTYNAKYGSETHTYYSYDIASKTNVTSKKKLITSNFKSQKIWLPGTCTKVASSTGSAWFKGLRCVTADGKIDMIDTYDYGDDGNYRDATVSAVVTLKSTVTLTRNAGASDSDYIWDIN